MKTLCFVFALLAVILCRSLTTQERPSHDFLYYTNPVVYRTYYPTWGTRSWLWKHNDREDNSHNSQDDDKAHNWWSTTTTRTFTPIYWKHNSADEE